MPKSRFVPVQVDAKTYEPYKRYSELTGVPVARVVRKALLDWMSTIGEAHLEAAMMAVASDVRSQAVLMMPTKATELLEKPAVSVSPPS